MLQVNDPVKVVKEMFEYASDETYSNDGTSGEKLTEVRKNGEPWWMRPDGKTRTQARIGYSLKSLRRSMKLFD